MHPGCSLIKTAHRGESGKVRIGCDWQMLLRKSEPGANEHSLYSACAESSACSCEQKCFCDCKRQFHRNNCLYTQLQSLCLLLVDSRMSGRLTP